MYNVRVGEDHGLLPGGVHKNGLFREKKVDRHQDARRCGAHIAAHHVGLVAHLGQKQKRQCAGQVGNIADALPRNPGIGGEKQQLADRHRLALRTGKAVDEHPVEHLIGKG